MRILHLIDHLGLGGAQRLVVDLFNSQPENEDIFLFALRRSNLQIDIEHPNVMIFRSYRRLSPVPLIKIIRIIKKENIDILHCHLFKSQIFGVLIKALLLPRIKLVFHEHGRLFQNRTCYTWFLKLSKCRVDRFIAVSDAAKNLLIERGKINPHKIVSLYNFIDTNKFQSHPDPAFIKSSREKLGLSENNFVVGFAGRLITSKGWKKFVQAIPLLIEKMDSFRFLIAGDGNDKQEMLELIQSLQVQDFVTYLGYQRCMSNFYSLLDCFVVPSYRESMGLTVIEAQAMGLPVVATDVSALNEIIRNGHDGLLFELHNLDDLVKKIMLIYTDQKLREALIHNGLQNAQSFNAPQYIATLNRLYSQI